MADQPVRVVARFAVRADKVKDFIRLARQKLVAPTRKEKGCIEYDLCQDVSDPTRFSMIETWSSEADLRAHLDQPSLQAAVAELGPMAAEPPSVSRLRSIDG